MSRFTSSLQAIERERAQRRVKTFDEARRLARQDIREGKRMTPFYASAKTRVALTREYEKEFDTFSRKKNPVAPLQSRIDSSAQAFKDFTGHSARGVRRVKVKDFSVGWPLGKLDAVLYSTVRDGKREKYIHRFRAQSRPHLAVNSDGTRLAIVGGRFRVKDTGINDE